ncbi:MAG: LCP family protein [Capsulimonadaceae bacterium]
MSQRVTVLKRIGAVVAVLAVGIVGYASTQAWKALHNHGSIANPHGANTPLEAVGDLWQILGDPKGGFPNKDKIVICGMGIDDNWTDRDEVYTNAARTDTLFLLTLNLKDKTASMLSIPRDTYTHIAGTDTSSKINSAYTTGGPARSVATVAEMTGIQPDYYMVLNIDATKKLVDALGGVDVDVDHEMHYHDKWGHLSIDLMPGKNEHLDGDQAVGFARYRHPDAGMKPTPEDGDERRMARQHILLRAMVVRAKNMLNIAQAGHLFDVAMQEIHTNLSRKQLLELARIYASIQPDEIRTASLPGEDFHGPHGGWDYRLYPDKMKAYLDWLVRGNPAASRQLVRVLIANGTSVPDLATHAADQLRKQGYTDVTVVPVPRRDVELTSSTSTTAFATTSLVDTGVPDPNAPRDVASILGVSQATMLRQPVQPNRRGWTPPVSLKIVLGQDYAQAVQAAGGISPVTTASDASAQ